MSEQDWMAAQSLWRSGKDTLFIARMFGVKESVIYNRISFLKREKVELPRFPPIKSVKVA